MGLLTWALVVYIMIGLSITAFCVHMSYHEASIGFGDSDDLKAQKVLESRIGPLGFIFLFTFWPLALAIAFMGASKSGAATEAAPSTAVPTSSATPAEPAPAPAPQQ